MEQYHIISLQSPNFRGRKKMPGRLIYDPSVGKLGVFVCYCSNCNSKIIADKNTVTYLSKSIIKSQKKWSVRLLQSMLKKLE